MRKRILILLLCLTMLLGVLAGCSNDSDIITQEQAMEVALEDAGVTADQITDTHIHIMEQNGEPCYSIHYNVGSTAYSFMVSVSTGKIVGYGH